MEVLSWWLDTLKNYLIVYLYLEHNTLLHRHHQYMTLSSMSSHQTDIITCDTVIGVITSDWRHYTWHCHRCHHIRLTSLQVTLSSALSHQTDVLTRDTVIDVITSDWHHYMWHCRRRHHIRLTSLHVTLSSTSPHRTDIITCDTVVDVITSDWHQYIRQHKNSRQAVKS